MTGIREREMPGRDGHAREVSPVPPELAAWIEAMWTRLITIANECWVATYRAAYSTIVSEALDIGCEILDRRGGSLAHGTRSIPVFNMIMPGVVNAILEKFGDEIAEGDVFVTNDPWLCAGHLPDIAVVSPVFRRRQLAAFVANVANVSDIGGNLNRPLNRDVYEEGLQIPLLKLYAKGHRVDPLWELLLANVRTEDEVEGDIEAMIAGNQLAGLGIAKLMDDAGLGTLDELSDNVCILSEAAMRNAIEAIPDGVSEASWTADGLDVPIELKVRVEVQGSDIHVSFPDAPPQVEVGAFNSTLNYTTAHVNYAMKCLIAPTIPTNMGCFRPVHVHAEPGTLLNCLRPAAVDMRTRIGWQVHPLLFGAMARFLPTAVPAGCGQPSLLSLDGRWADGRKFQEHLMLGAGMGAWSGGVGEDNSTFPSSAASGSIEIFEHRSPVWVVERSLVPGSGGEGRHRGGRGESLTVRLRDGEGRSLRIVHALERMTVAPPGLAGGGAGARATLVRTDSHGSRPEHNRVVELVPGDSLTVQTAGGGGYGALLAEPAQRIEGLP
jgi:N-methylhydantoinase B/oxoprolinase/acetone carboxylase alpha subunit